MSTATCTNASQRPATVRDIIDRLTAEPRYRMTAETALPWGMGAVTGITAALDEAIEQGVARVVKLGPSGSHSQVRFVAAVEAEPLTPTDHNTIAAALAGGTHRAHASIADVVAREDSLGHDRAHGRRCACCALPRPRGPLTTELAAVRARLDRMAERAAFLVLPAVDLRTAITGGAA